MAIVLGWSYLTDFPQLTKVFTDLIFRIDPLPSSAHKCNERNPTSDKKTAFCSDVLLNAAQRKCACIETDRAIPDL